MRYGAKRSYAWSPGIAYATGLIASDGCLQKDGRHIDLTSKDREQLVNFSAALGRTLTIGRKSSGRKDSAYRIQFGDVALYDFLLAAGLTPAKSKTLGPVNVPDEFYADFLRGLFDGDGSCYGYEDVRWRSSFMFYTSFTSASPVFLSFLQMNNARLIGLIGSSIRQGKRARSLVYAKADSYKLFRYMYYQGHSICLARKKLKLKAFMCRDQTGIIAQHNQPEW